MKRIVIRVSEESAADVKAYSVTHSCTMGEAADAMLQGIARPSKTNGAKANASKPTFGKDMVAELRAYAKAKDVTFDAAVLAFVNTGMKRRQALAKYNAQA